MFFHKNKKLLVIILSVLIVLSMLISFLAMFGSVQAAELSSSELAETRKAIKAQLDAAGGVLNGLQGDADTLNGQMEDLQGQLDENASQTQTVVDKKYDFDQKIELLRLQVQNTNDQIQEYNKLIASRQQELDMAIADEEQQNEKYKKRLRTMEEEGTISYLSILFKARSFADLLDRIDMINEIAESDQRLLEQLGLARQAVVDAQQALEADKQELNKSKELLAQQEADLEAERVEANGLIASLDDDADVYKEQYGVYEEQEQELQEQILAQLAAFQDIQSEYDKALAEEEAAKAREAEVERQRQAASASTKISSTSQDAEYYSTYSTASASESGFICPLPSGWVVTDPFGYRIHPITGANSFHTGTDMAIGSGTNIYAAKSGTVVTAAVSPAYGNYVVISHGSGQATLYGHMSSMAVSAGDYVTQGQTIGYVGSTGWSTGPHLHFEIIIDGEYYNALEYIS